MKTRRVTRYIASCGRGFWNKNSCLYHESRCECWSNPKLRTCKTCKFCNIIHDSNGMEHEPHNLQVWRQIKCANPKFNYDIHFNQAHPTVHDLCINCSMWESNKKGGADDTK